jgi:hypothetical protein
MPTHFLWLDEVEKTSSQEKHFRVNTWENMTTWFSNVVSTFLVWKRVFLSFFRWFAKSEKRKFIFNRCHCVFLQNKNSLQSGVENEKKI